MDKELFMVLWVIVEEDPVHFRLEKTVLCSFARKVARCHLQEKSPPEKSPSKNLLQTHSLFTLSDHGPPAHILALLSLSALSLCSLSLSLGLSLSLRLIDVEKRVCGGRKEERWIWIHTRMSCLIQGHGAISRSNGPSTLPTLPVEGLRTILETGDEEMSYTPRGAFRMTLDLWAVPTTASTCPENTQPVIDPHTRSRSPLRCTLTSDVNSDEAPLPTGDADAPKRTSRDTGNFRPLCAPSHSTPSSRASSAATTEASAMSPMLASLFGARMHGSTATSTPLPLRRIKSTPSLLPPAPSSHNAVAQARMDRFSSFAQSHYPRKFMAHHQVFDELGSPEDLEADARADQDRCPLRVRVRLVSPQAHVQQRA